MSDSRAPAGTTIRFALLVTLALATAASIYAIVMPPGLRRTLRAFDECHVRAGTYFDDNPINVWQSAGQQAGLTRFGECVSELVPQRLWAMIGGMLGLLVVAALLYYLQPYWRIARSRLVPLDPLDAAEVLAALNSLATQAGLRRQPTFLVDPVNPHVGGLAFGRGRDPYVCLHAGLLTLFRRDPVSFRAVVLHELAHLRNRDVATTYLTLAVWRAFLLVALLPWVLTLVFPDSWPAGSTGIVLESAGRVAILVLIVYLSRNAVLRSREWHADARVSRWLGSTTPSECLPSLSGGRRWAVLLRTHPTAASRAAVLADRTFLLRPGFWESFAAGLAFQLGWIQVAMPMITWGGSPEPVLWVLHRAWGVGLAALLLVAALRTAAYRAAGGGSRWVLVVPGLALVAGAVVGEGLPVMGAGSLLPGLPAIIAGAVLAVQVVLLSCWVVWLAGMIRVRPSVRVRRIAWLAVGATVGGLCVSWLSWWSSFARLDVIVEVVRQTQATLLRIADVTWTGVDHALISVVLHPVVLGFAEPNTPALVCLVLIWAVPLALGAARGMVRFALLAGLIGGAAWLAVELIIRAVLRGDLDATVRASEAVTEVLTAWEIGAVVLAQAVVAAVVVARRPNLAAGLLAAATTGLVGGLSIWALHATDACVPLFQATMTRCPVPLDPGFGATVLGIVTAEGTVTALIGVCVGYLLRIRAPMIGPARRPRRITATGVAGVAAVSMLLLAWPRPVSTGNGPVERASAAERAAPAPDSPEAIRTWLRAGGLAHLDAITAEIGGIVRSVGTDSVDLAAMRAASVRLRAAVADARRYPDPPGGKSAGAWRGGLLAIGTAAGIVTRAIDTENAPVLEKAIPLLSRGYDLLLELPHAVS